MSLSCGSLSSYTILFEMQRRRQSPTFQAYTQQWLAAPRVTPYLSYKNRNAKACYDIFSNLHQSCIIILFA